MAGKSPREAAQARAKARQARARIHKGSKTGVYRKKQSLGRNMLNLATAAFKPARQKTPQEMRRTKYPAIGKKKPTTKRTSTRRKK